MPNLALYDIVFALARLSELSKRKAALDLLLSMFFQLLERGLKAKSMVVSEVRAIVLDYSVDLIFLDLVVPEIIYFKQDVGPSPIL